MMTLDKEIIKKIEKGDSLTDAELKLAIKFYAGMSKGLRLLGPAYYFPEVETSRIAYRLIGFALHRELFRTHDAAEKFAGLRE